MQSKLQIVNTKQTSYIILPHNIVNQRTLAWKPYDSNEYALNNTTTQEIDDLKILKLKVAREM